MACYCMRLCMCVRVCACVYVCECVGVSVRMCVCGQLLLLIVSIDNVSSVTHPMCHVFFVNR